ncbi:hypothetical protein [Megalodesulfovibrio paquesii]
MKKGVSLRLTGTSLVPTRFVALLAAALLLTGVASQALAAEKFWVEAAGYVLFKNDRGDVVRKDFAQYRDVLFEDQPKKVGYFLCTLDGLETQVPVRDVSMVKRDPSTDFGAVVSMATGSHAVKVPHDLAVSLTGMPHLELEYFNPLTGKNEIGFLPGVDILEIHFTDTTRVSK